MSSLLFGSSYHRQQQQQQQQQQQEQGGACLSNNVTSDADPHKQGRLSELPEFMRTNEYNGNDSHHHHHHHHHDPEDDEDYYLQGGSVTSASDPDPNEYEKTINGLGMKKAVKYSRIAVLVILLVSAVGLAVFIYLYSDRSEQRQFEKQFKEDARKVLEHVGTELDFTLGAADAFLVDEINIAQLTNQSWPFVTNSRFAVRAAKLRSLTKSLVLITYPFVTDAQRQAWEDYTVKHDSWVQEGLLVQQNDKNFKGLQVTTWSTWGRIHSNDGLHLGPGPYFPTWSSYPIVPVYAPYNWDIRMVSVSMGKNSVGVLSTLIMASLSLSLPHFRSIIARKWKLVGIPSVL